MGWKEEYIKMLGCYDPNELQIESSQLLKEINMPRFLYKYRPASDYAINNLATDTVWLNSPYDYNDPFECVEYLDFKKLHEINANEFVDDYFSQVTAKYTVPIDLINSFKESENPMRSLSAYILAKYESYDEDTITTILNAFDSVLNKVSEDGFQQRNMRMQQTLKVCSFCESPSQLLMWGHYADFHKGFCIEYDLSKWGLNDIRRRLLCPVIYSNKLYDSTEHHIKSIINGRFNNLYPIISCATKSIEWSYEREWRFIFNIGPSFDKQNYRMDCQSKVYLGLRIEPKREQQILDICKARRISLFRAKQSFDKYELNFEMIYKP